MAERHGVLTYDLTDTVVDELRDLTEGRGADSVAMPSGWKRTAKVEWSSSSVRSGCFRMLSHG